MMMKSLPIILKREKVTDERFLRFITSEECLDEDKEDLMGHPLNIERTIECPRFKNMASTNLKIHMVETDEDFHRIITKDLIEQEVID